MLRIVSPACASSQTKLSGIRQGASPSRRSAPPPQRARPECDDAPLDHGFRLKLKKLTQQLLPALMGKGDSHRSVVPVKARPPAQRACVIPARCPTRHDKDIGAPPMG